jgi:hypothetical protein
VINDKLSKFFQGRELPVSKKTYDNFGTWLEKN